MKRLLIISPHFPPINAPDMHRIRMGLKFYRENGWEPTVLTVDPDLQEAAHDKELCATIPEDVRVICCPALFAPLTRAMGVRNIGLRAWPFLWRGGCRILEQEKFDLVLFSTTQFAILPLGRLWKKRYGVPYVIDIQDPWRTDYYDLPGARKPPGGWKYKFAKLQASLLEGWSFREASAFISVSEGYFVDLDKRYPWFKTIPKTHLNFGASAEDFVIAGKTKSLLPPVTDKSKIRFVYTGAAGPIMPTALNAFCDALVEYRQHSPAKAQQFRFEFIGTSYAAPEDAAVSVLPIAENHGLEDLFSEIPSRQGHLECMRQQQLADILLLLGSSDLSYSPSKLYHYFLAQKPILAITFPNSVLQRNLQRLNCARIISVPVNSGDSWDMSTLWQFFDDALSGFPSGSLPERDTVSFDYLFSAENQTRRQCELFESALRHHRKS
jgi:hypothetical protein